MKVVFAGTPEFAAVALRAILHAGYEVPLVLTQPDRPAGRGMALQASPVKKIAEAAGIPVFQPNSLRDAKAQAVLRALGAEIMIVAAYGLILPQAVLDIPRLGCLNIHASLLPRWRGAAPIQRAILAGDAETGVCIMQMEAGLDTGPVLARVREDIRPDDCASSLHDRLAVLGADLMVRTLAALPGIAETQPSEGVTYAAKIEKAEGLIDWRRSAIEIDRQIRAFNPFPGAQARLAGQPVKLWRATLADGEGPAGRILQVDRDGLRVACGHGALNLTELQKAGGKRLTVGQFLAGHTITPGVGFDLLTDG